MLRTYKELYKELPRWALVTYCLTSIVVVIAATITTPIVGALAFISYAFGIPYIIDYLREP